MKEQSENNELYHVLFVDDDHNFLHSMRIVISKKLHMENDDFNLKLHFV